MKPVICSIWTISAVCTQPLPVTKRHTKNWIPCAGRLPLCKWMRRRKHVGWISFSFKLKNWNGQNSAREKRKNWRHEKPSSAAQTSWWPQWKAPMGRSLVMRIEMGRPVSWQKRRAVSHLSWTFPVNSRKYLESWRIFVIRRKTQRNAYGICAAASIFPPVNWTR